jgi:hypothetical protein
LTPVVFEPTAEGSYEAHHFGLIDPVLQSKIFNPKSKIVHSLYCETGCTPPFAHRAHYRIFRSQIMFNKRSTTMSDQSVMKHIEDLVAEEQRLYAKSHLNQEEKDRVHAIKVELDQYWDLLRQRRALEEFGDDPDKAKLRGPDTVEKYQQ